MPRSKIISDDEILSIARSLFLQEGAKASTRTLAKMVGISEAVIFQRFGTKEDLFFAAMVPPSAKLETMFNVQPGQQQVMTNLVSISLQIVIYLREVMPVFLSLISHPAFEMRTFLQRHTMPAIQINRYLIDYLNAEAELKRIRQESAATVAAVLFSYLHNIALSETIDTHQSSDTELSISAAIALLWRGMEP
jgi:AcrR family transcriptional regulator